jgi:hypothetical protein
VAEVGVLETQMLEDTAATVVLELLLFVTRK